MLESDVDELSVDDALESPLLLSLFDRFDGPEYRSDSQPPPFKMKLPPPIIRRASDRLAARGFRSHVLEVPGRQTADQDAVMVREFLETELPKVDQAMLIGPGPSDAPSPTPERETFVHTLV